MIKVKLMGGLGNQMFQYALGKTLSIKNNTALELDLVFLNHRLKNTTYVFREFDLDIFDIKYNFGILSKAQKCFRNSLYILTKLIEILAKKLRYKKYFFEKTPYKFDPSVFETIGDIKLIGFWQSYKYFDSIKDSLLKEFSSFSHPLQIHSCELMDKIEKVESVCVNFRRTDYVNNPETKNLHGEIGLNYYEKALEYISNKVKKPVFFVFSDDIDWCKKNFQTEKGEVVFVGNDYFGYKFSDYLRLISACKHQIIPNSTFSWWGAWLNQNPNKIVIAPKQWTVKKTSGELDILPPSWIQI